MRSTGYWCGQPSSSSVASAQVHSIERNSRDGVQELWLSYESRGCASEWERVYLDGRLSIELFLSVTGLGHVLLVSSAVTFQARSESYTCSQVRRKCMPESISILVAMLLTKQLAALPILAIAQGVASQNATATTTAITPIMVVGAMPQCAVSCTMLCHGSNTC